MTNSIARNNIVYNEPSGIFVSQSHNNQIYNNTISKCGDGININSGSSNNKILANTIFHSTTNAIFVASGASSNTFSSNKIVASSPQGLKIEQDPTSKNNIFSNNQPYWYHIATCFFLQMVRKRIQAAFASGS